VCLASFANICHLGISGEIKLDIPDLALDGDIIELSMQPELMDQIEEACGNWQQQIASAIELQLKKKPQVPSTVSRLSNRAA